MEIFSAEHLMAFRLDLGLKNMNFYCIYRQSGIIIEIYTNSPSQPFSNTERNFCGICEDFEEKIREI